MDNATYYRLDRREIVPLLPRQCSTVLEVGCGEGEFRENLSQDSEYWGIEPVAEVAAIAANRLDKTLVGTYESTLDQIPDSYFDLVICNDVIEHMSDHDAFFQSIKSKLKPNGQIVASIPNVRYVRNLFEVFVKKDWKYKDSGILDRTHLRFFTEKSLNRTISENGFLVDQFMGINPYTHRSFLARGACRLAALLLGQDIRFLQFAVRIRPA